MAFTSEDQSIITLQRCPDLEIRCDTPKGRGVFATRTISAKTVIDVSPVLVLGLEENQDHIERTSLYHYTYNWPITHSNGKRIIAQAVILGLGSMFNHSMRDQNVVWERSLDQLTVTYRALRDIAAGEELCISYGTNLTFKDADAPALPSPQEEIDQLNQIEID